jgi:hypothetical protein
MNSITISFALFAKDSFFAWYIPSIALNIRSS